MRGDDYGPRVDPVEDWAEQSRRYQQRAEAAEALLERVREALERLSALYKSDRATGGREFGSDYYQGMSAGADEVLAILGET